LQGVFRNYNYFIHGIKILSAQK